jgi:hypothetical protein
MKEVPLSDVCPKNKFIFIYFLFSVDNITTGCHMLGRECPEAVLPDRASPLPTLSHLLIDSKLPSSLSVDATSAHEHAGVCIGIIVHAATAACTCLTVFAHTLVAFGTWLPGNEGGCLLLWTPLIQTELARVVSQSL